MAKFTIHNTPQHVISSAGPSNGSVQQAGFNPEDYESVRRTVAGGFDGNDNVTTGNDSGSGKREQPNTTEFINPSSGTNSSDSGTSTRTRRRRSDAGFKRGVRVRETQTSADLKSLLLTIHFGLAGVLHSPKLKLTEGEAEQLANALKRVTDLYDVHILPEKQMAWLNLAIVSGAIYLPRIRKETTPKDERPKVVPFTPQQSTGDSPKVM